MLRSFLTLCATLLLWLSLGLPTEAQSIDAGPSTSNFSQTAIEQFEQLRQNAFAATNEGNFAAAESYWDELLKQFPDSAALWSNRGNARVSQNKLELALEDYNQAIALAPEAPDPYLNRGTALEGLGQWQAAIADYNRVLELSPNDPAAYNNRGNAQAGLGQWERAIADYQQAAELAPDYAFAQANYALALYQVGRSEEALQKMRGLVRKYPKFADMRAALTAALWVKGKYGEAESNWVAVTGLDGRYKDIDWVAHTRRWPPAMVQALQQFLELQA
jgi:tetratricopeptide (TPR) repeat protein